jgi:hypothetical protein
MSIKTMTIALNFYAKVIDNLCIAYYGLPPEYLVQLDYLRQVIKKIYPDLSMSILARKELHYIVEGIEELDTLDKSRYAYIKEIRIDPNEHPILNFIKESNLNFEHIQPKNQDNKFCLVCPNAIHPSKEMTQVQLEKCYHLAKDRGYCPIVLGVDIEVDAEGKIDAVEQAGCVIGAENEYVFLAAVRGIKSVLVPTGLGTELYKTMFPDGEVYERI